MKTLKLALLATVIAATPMAAFAQDVGATIFGNDGNPIGTVEQADDKIVVIDTGKHKAPVGANMIYESEAGPSLNTTKAQIEAMIDKQVAEAATKRDAALVEGAAVMSVNGNPTGTLKSVDMASDAIILESPTGLVGLEGTFRRQSARSADRAVHARTNRHHSRKRHRWRPAERSNAYALVGVAIGPRMLSRRPRPFCQSKRLFLGKPCGGIRPAAPRATFHCQMSVSVRVRSPPPIGQLSPSSSTKVIASAMPPSR